MQDAPTVRVMPPALADEIAAGEVVERPASALKELVENALDAGARRVEVGLWEGGLERMVVQDDGAGMHPEDVRLCIVRHATSKLRSRRDLEDVRTLGFRGEALASLAAVATLEIRSRRARDAVGTRLRVAPGRPPEVQPCGMPAGTRVEVRDLFAHVPARRKFLRAKATETAACVETALRVALGHPRVTVVLDSDGRRLVDLAGADEPGRVAAIFERRGHGPPVAADAQVGGVGVRVYLVPPAQTRRGRGLLYVVVRNRVVDERAVASAVRGAIAPALPEGAGPVAVAFVDPPPGAVDVNVHPQKTQVRFSDPQGVLHAVRTACAAALAKAPAVPPERRPGAAADRAAEVVRTRATYRLATSAVSADAALRRSAVRSAVNGLLRGPGPGARGGSAPCPPPDDGPGRAKADAVPAPDRLTYAGALGPEVALFLRAERLLVVDLPALREHLVAARLRADLAAGHGGGQGLLVPVVVPVAPEDAKALEAAAPALARLGFEIEPFGADAVRVRAVPAALAPEEAEVRGAVARLCGWARLRARGRAALEDAARFLAEGAKVPTGVSARTARAWLVEALAAADGGEVPGVRVFTAADLLGKVRGGGP